MNIGIFGGLFDPPHIGHLIIAQSVLEEFHLQKIIFIPAGHPPHKTKYSPYHVRYAMTTLAIRGNKNFFISDIEKKIPGKTYTVEVMKELKKKYKAQLYFVIGSDQWEEIGTWKDPHALFTECNVVVVPRPHCAMKKTRRFFKKILVGHSPLIDISSTVIRKKLKQHCSIQYLVPSAVYNYIKRKKLYR